MQGKKVFISIFLGITLLGVGCFACSGGYLVWNRLTFEPTQANFPLQEKWAFEAEEEIESTPRVSGDYVVIRTQERLYTLDATQGTLLWQARAKKEHNSGVSNPLIHQNMVFMTDGDGMRAFDLATGNIVWNIPDDSFVRTMYVAGATDEVIVFVRTSIMVRDIETGELVWEARPAGLSPTVVIAKGQVHAFTNNQFLVYDLQSGELQGETITQGKRDGGGEYFGGKHFYIRGNEGLFAYDVETKEIVWQREDFKHIDYPIYQYGDMLLLSDIQPYALDERKGKLLWQSKVPRGEGYYPPVIVDYVAYTRSIGTRRIFCL